MIVIADEEKRNTCTGWYNRMQINKNNVFTNTAMMAAYSNGEPWLDQLIIYLKDNIKELKSRLSNNLPQVKLIEPDGTYLVWLDFRELGMDAKQLETFLSKDAKIATNPGHWFGREGAGFARINIACPRSVMLRGIKQLEQAIKQFSSQKTGMKRGT
jgi:cystathionine beta-lyase